MSTNPQANPAIPPKAPAAAPEEAAQEQQGTVPPISGNSQPPNGNPGGQGLHPLQILSIREVEAMVGFDKSTVYRKIAAGRFPDRVRLSPNRVGWLRGEIEAWLRDRADERKTR